MLRKHIPAVALTFWWQVNANTNTGRLRKNRVEKWIISTLPAGSLMKLEDAKCHITMAQRYATANSDTMLVYFNESSFRMKDNGTIAVTINSVIQNRLSNKILSWLLMPASDVIIYKPFNVLVLIVLPQPVCRTYRRHQIPNNQHVRYAYSEAFDSDSQIKENGSWGPCQLRYCKKWSASPFCSSCTSW